MGILPLHSLEQSRVKCTAISLATLFVQPLAYRVILPFFAAKLAQRAAYLCTDVSLSRSVLPGSEVGQRFQFDQIKKQAVSSLNKNDFQCHLPYSAVPMGLTDLKPVW